MALSDSLVKELAATYHTPLYVFEESVVRRQCSALRRAIPYPNKIIRYACKALTLQAILKVVRDEGLHVDASSYNEVLRALRAGFAPQEILHTGEGASLQVFSELLARNVLINCSSLDQVRLIGRLKPGATLSIRFNPGEGHGANNKVNTGGPASKHGVYCDQLDETKKILKEYRLRLNGVHAHIGSGADLAHWLRIKDLTLEIARQFEDLDFIDLGGGIPVVYNPETDKPMPLDEWGENLSESFSAFSEEYGKQIQLQIEPGRYIVAECGHLIAEIQNIKRTPSYNFVIVNSGFNHNPRPAMYGSYHPIRFVSRNERREHEQVEYVVAGYLCESGDVFTVGEGGTLVPRKFQKLQLGDLMVMGNIGAYSHSMKSDYNSMNLPPSILVQQDGEIRVIERRGTIDDVIRREVEAYHEGPIYSSRKN